MRISLYLAGMLSGAVLGTAANAAPVAQARILQLYSYALKDQAQFELGYRRHLAWHEAHADKLVWYAWMVDSGPRKGLFIDGTAGASYGGLDARPDPADDGADATRNFVPFVLPVNVETWETWSDVSTATPLEDRSPAAQADVFFLYVAPGASVGFEQALTRLAAKRSPDAPSLTWYRAIRGGAVPAYLLILSRSNWADLDRAGGTLNLLLGRAYGVAPAQVEKALAAVAKVETESWSYLPRLSLIPGKALTPQP